LNRSSKGIRKAKLIRILEGWSPFGEEINLYISSPIFIQFPKIQVLIDLSIFPFLAGNTLGQTIKFLEEGAPTIHSCHSILTPTLLMIFEGLQDQDMTQSILLAHKEWIKIQMEVEILLALIPLANHLEVWAVALLTRADFYDIL
jgi:hypothetical protein